MNIYFIISIIIIIIIIILALLIYQKIFIKNIEICIPINELIDEINLDKLNRLDKENINIKFKWLDYNFEITNKQTLYRQINFAPMILNKIIDSFKKLKNMFTGNAKFNLSVVDTINYLLYESDIKIYTDAPKNIKLKLLKRNNLIYIVKLKSKKNETFINSPADKSLIGYQQYDAYFGNVLDKFTDKIIDNTKPLEKKHPTYYYNTDTNVVRWI